MDDFVPSNLHESRNEWCARLVSTLTPLVIDGMRSIFNEAWNMCITNDEAGKYLMTFQNLLCRIPKWNTVIVEEERKRIVEKSGCGYLEDLITCVHIIQLKVLTCIRVGNRQKKIDISIPKLDVFLHKVYINVARKVYTNVYLFEKNISPLQIQKNNRELEVIVQECILVAIRDSIPTEAIIRAYLDESTEQEEEVIIENIQEPVPEPEPEPVASTGGSAEQEPQEAPIIPPKPEEDPYVAPTITNISDEPISMKLSFNDYDQVRDVENKEQVVSAPKTLERLDRIATERAMQRSLDESDDEDEPQDRIQIHMDDSPIDLSDLIEDTTAKPTTISLDDPISLDFETL